MGFAAALRYFRQQRGWSLQDLAWRAGVSKQALSLYETGQANPRLDIASRLADALGVSIDALSGRG